MNNFYYQLDAIPDPYQTAANLKYGNFKETFFESWNSLCRLISEMQTDTISFSLCLYFNPDLSSGVQKRLKIWLKIQSRGQIEKNDVKSLILDGPISEFYSFTEVEENLVNETLLKNFNATGEIVRRLDKIQSYISKSQNSNVLNNYLSLKPFEAQNNNDFMKLDRQLSGMENPAYIEIKIKPTNIKKEISNQYKYISKLVKINDSDFHEPETLNEEYRSKKGFQRDHLAEEILREHEELANNFRKPHLEFFIRIMTYKMETLKILASTIAESAFMNGNYSILTCEKNDVQHKKLALNVFEIDHNWQKHKNTPKPFIRFPRLATVEELRGIFRTPLGSRTSPRTIRKITDPIPFENTKNTILIGDDMESGVSSKRNYHHIEKLFRKPSETAIEHRLPLEILKKHMFISGVPGSGKTTAMFNILIQLNLADIPFLIIEPAKTEYRILKLLKHHKNKMLKNLGENIRVYSPGNEELSPFRINPMSFPNGISLDEHINNLMSCFEAAMPINDGPLPALIAEAVEVVYEHKNEPYLEDLVKAIKNIMEIKNYDPEIKGNLETAINVRLSPLIRRSMGKVFSKPENPLDFENLLKNPAIIEMDALSQEQANLLTLFILTTIREHIKVSRQSGDNLKHIIVLEEAHNVVGRIPAGSNNDPREKAASYISRMLAELRALGEGIIIADQLPSTVASSVIKNTGTKLAHRLTSMDDRKELGSTMLAEEVEIEEFARLLVGEAFYYTEGLYRCRRIRCLNSNAFMNLSQPPKDDLLIKEIMYENWFKNNALYHLENELKYVIDYIKNDLYNRISNLEEEVNKLSDEEKNPQLYSELKEKCIMIDTEIFEVINLEKINDKLTSKADKLNSIAIYENLLFEMKSLIAVVVDELQNIKKKLASKK